MSLREDVSLLAARIETLAAARGRIIVAIAGPPASGKSTLVEALAAALEGAVIVPMDGFHLDNEVLAQHGLMARKGSPASFDADGYCDLLRRVRHHQGTVYAPLFDRSADLSRAGAIEISSDTTIILTEGNYLLLDQSPWNSLLDGFDWTVFLDVPEAVLQARLIQRWLDQGLSIEAATARANSNDLPNALRVNRHSKPANQTINYY